MKDTSYFLKHSHVGFNWKSRELFLETLQTCSNASLSTLGQLVVATGQFTGRCADDKYIVDNVKLSSGPAGTLIDNGLFDRLCSRIQSYLIGRRVYVVDFIASKFKCRVIAERPWHAQFIINMFGQVKEHVSDEIDLLIIDVPDCTAGDDFRNDVAIACDFKNGLCLITGTEYAGEIKKSVFSFVSYKAPLENNLPMHASVVTDSYSGNTMIFFGLSGTGKTTLSSDDHLKLLGDDEHVWSSQGIHNIESGCYAKVINLSAEKEPLIHKACSRFGTILENVSLDQEGYPDYASQVLAENSRASYPLSFIDDSHPPGTSIPHPTDIIMLTCDATGVLPSVMKLDKNAAIYHFLSGYTAKIAGTEKGIKEPKITFSRCFGAPFMPHEPKLYADILRFNIERFDPKVWLINTGWVEGPYGVGKRIEIGLTRHIINCIRRNEFFCPFERHPILNVEVPVDFEHSDPRSEWNSVDEYDAALHKLVSLFNENSLKTMQGIDCNIIKAGPCL